MYLPSVHFHSDAGRLGPLGSALASLAGLMDTFDPNFNIVTPDQP